MRWRCSVPGAHNAVNAAGALTAAARAGADPQAAAASLVDFRGARRRLERLGTTSSGAAVYDDYAHHPTEVAAAIAAARTLGPGRLVAVLQPHLFSRTQALTREFGVALAQADVGAVLPIYPARERASGLPRGRRAAGCRGGGRRRGRPADGVASRASTTRGGSSIASLRAGDLCLMMGAGDIDALGRSLVA